MKGTIRTLAMAKEKIITPKAKGSRFGKFIFFFGLG